jgi:alpha-1,2-mannosyltransferase
VACLISPITWVHHLVWLLPALFLLLTRALSATDRRDRRRATIILVSAYVVLCSSLVWWWWAHPYGWAALPGSNAYVWVSAALLISINWQASIGVRGSMRGYGGSEGVGR